MKCTECKNYNKISAQCDQCVDNDPNMPKDQDIFCGEVDNQEDYLPEDMP